MASVYFITGNANKLKEVKAVLEPHVEVSSQAIDLEEIQGSIEEVTIAKCTKAAVLVCDIMETEGGRRATTNYVRFM